ncbi:hypothetical protein DNTS_013698, partial [Danionella cerebrum]
MERLLGSSVFRWWRLLSVTLLVLPHSSSYSIPSLEVLNSEGIGGAKAPVHLGEINHQCWDAASLSVIEARKLRVADSVGELWDFMTQLSGSTQGLHRSMFMELAQVFWKKTHRSISSVSSSDSAWNLPPGMQTIYTARSIPSLLENRQSEKLNLEDFSFG